MSKPIIEVENLSKLYKIGANREPYLSLRDEIAKFASRLRPKTRDQGQPETDFWALKDVSFNVQEGEVVGIIGRNGAGKSTLLKILSQITPPTKGHITIRGRVASLLEVGTGFHPELTGRENIFLNGAILGMGKAEIKRKFDEIVDFAEVEKFLDTPVKRYSSGMYVRLAFAVAAHLEPEILIVDEVLAVGDAEFQKKCLGKMGEVARGGRTVLFVSHNMVAIQNLCTIGMVLNSGRLECYGAVSDMLKHYIVSTSLNAKCNLRGVKERVGNGLVRITEVNLCNLRSEPVPGIPIGEGCKVYIVYECKIGYIPRDVEIGIAFISIMGVKVVMFSNKISGYALKMLPARGKVCCTIPSLPIAEGSYFIGVSFSSGNETNDWVDRAVNCNVLEKDFYGSGRLYPKGLSHLYLEHTWQLI